MTLRHHKWRLLVLHPIPLTNLAAITAPANTVGVRAPVSNDNRPVDNDELREELEAFDPKWQQHYRTTREAVLAAGPRAIELFRAWCAGPGKGCAACQQIPDTLAAIERIQRAEASLTVKLDTIGQLRPGRED